MINTDLLREYVEAGDRIGYWTALKRWAIPTARWRWAWR